MIGKREHMTYLGRTIKFPFPLYGTYIPSSDGIDAYLNRKTQVHFCFLCAETTKKEKCPSAHSSHALENHFETIASHHDCFSMFLQSCPLPPRLACERLWKVAIAKRPWPLGYQDLPAFSLTGAYHILCSEAVKKVASIYNIRQLTTFPTELVERIRSYSSGEPIFWRAVTALTMALSLSIFPAIDEQRVELTKLCHWERGGTIQTSGSEGRTTDVLRITFDIDGVRKIERFPRWPTCEKQPRTDGRFSWVLLEIDGNEIRDKTAYCQDGLLRFSFDDNGRAYVHEDLPLIWDTPTPPNLDSIEYVADKFLFPIAGGYDGSFAAGHLINLDSISGLTFVYEGKMLMAIHSHCGDEINNFGIPVGSRNGQQQACFFLPVTENDKIMAIGIGNFPRAFVVVVSIFIAHRPTTAISAIAVFPSLPPTYFGGATSSISLLLVSCLLTLFVF